MSPYRLSDDGMCVEKKDGDKWVEEKCHESKADAEAHMAALNKNVKEAGGSLDDFINRVRDAFYKQHQNDMGIYSWVIDVFEDHVIVRSEDHYYRVDLTVTDDAVTFGERVAWQEVKLDYVPVGSEQTEEPADTEAAATDTDAMEESLRLDIRIPLQEAKKDKDGLLDGVIVVEGPSANKNVYTAAALESGISIFDGALMFADHPTAVEETQRPERSVRDAVGRVVSPYMGKSESGKPALRAKFKISQAESALKTKIEEGILGDLSLRAFGQGKRDKATGHFVVEAFQANPFTSVDVVTIAAAGGGIEALAESQRTALTTAVLKGITSEDLARERPDLVQESVEVKQLKESQAVEQKKLEEVQADNTRLLEENTRMFKDLREGQAQGVLTGVLAEAAKALPKAAVERVQAQAKPLVESFATHGSQQTVEQLTEAVKGLVEAEKAYLAQIVPNGAVSGLTSVAEAPDAATAAKNLEEAFASIPGMGQQKAKLAARGR